MAKQPLYNTAGQTVGEVELAAALFEVEANPAVVHQAIKAHLAGARAGTAKAKTRGEIRGGGRKPWRQKGTGRARHGSRRSPVWVGGGQVFPPSPRSYAMRLPRKMRRLAFASALTAAAAEGRIRFVEALALEAVSTRALAAILGNLEMKGKVLVVAGQVDENLEKSARNLAGVTLITADALSTYDLVAYDALLMTRDAVARLEETRQ